MYLIKIKGLTHQEDIYASNNTSPKSMKEKLIQMQEETGKPK